MLLAPACNVRFQTEIDRDTDQSGNYSISSGGGIPPVDVPRDDVSGDARDAGEQVPPDAAEWAGNTSAFLRVVDDAAARVYRLVTSQLEFDVTELSAW